MKEMVSLFRRKLVSRLVTKTLSPKNVAISSLVVAIQMIATYCKKLKYRRKIILVTNGEGPMSGDDLDEIVKKIKSDNIELVVLYAFCDVLVAGIPTY